MLPPQEAGDRTCDPAGGSRPPRTEGARGPTRRSRDAGGGGKGPSANYREIFARGGTKYRDSAKRGRRGGGAKAFFHIRKTAPPLPPQSPDSPHKRGLGGVSATAGCRALPTPSSAPEPVRRAPHRAAFDAGRGRAEVSGALPLFFSSFVVTRLCAGALRRPEAPRRGTRGRGAPARAAPAAAQTPPLWAALGVLLCHLGGLRQRAIGTGLRGQRG